METGDGIEVQAKRAGGVPEQGAEVESGDEGVNQMQSQRKSSVPSSERWGGIVHASPGGQALNARYAWIDAESGERIVLEVIGSEEFFQSLEELGFERLEEDPPAARPGAWQALSA